METIRIQQLAVADKETVLDLGCGEGRHSIAAHFYFPSAFVIGVDLNFDSCKAALAKQLDFFTTKEVRSNAVKSPCDSLHTSDLLHTTDSLPPSDELPSTIHFTCASAFKLPLKTHSIDHIICSEVLEHIDDYHDVLKEIDRILKPNGTLTISVPRAWPEKICWALSRAYHQVEGGHVRIFNRRTLQFDITRRGYTHTNTHYAHALHSIYWWLRCAHWNNGNDNIISGIYHKLLVWDLLKRPLFTRWLETRLNPFLGKSMVMYFRRHKT